MAKCPDCKEKAMYPIDWKKELKKKDTVVLLCKNCGAKVTIKKESK